MWVGFSSRNTLISIDVKPNTALVVCPVVVEKFSGGSAWNARYAEECPSSSSSVGLVSPTPETLVRGSDTNCDTRPRGPRDRVCSKIHVTTSGDAEVRLL